MEPVSPDKEYKYDVSLCIPFAGGLWESAIQTLNHLAMVLVESKLSHEIIVVANNTTEQGLETLAKLLAVRDFGVAHNSRLLVNDIPSNGLAANAAAEVAQGRYLCFTDAHVNVSSNIFTEMIKLMAANPKAGMVHAPITWTGVPYGADFKIDPNKRCYQYLYKEYDHKKFPGRWYLENHFHGSYGHFHDGTLNPRKIAGCGHGFFMMRHDVWNKVGGYHPGQRSYGGREPFLTFKCWMYGYENYTVPATHHIHSNLARGYEWVSDMDKKPKHKGFDCWSINCMQSAYCIGGEEWLNKIYESFKAKPGVRPDIIIQLRDEAKATSTVERQHVLDNKVIEFNDLWAKFKAENIFY